MRAVKLLESLGLMRGPDWDGEIGTACLPRTRFQWVYTGTDWTIAFIFNEEHFRIPGSATKHPMCAAEKWGPVIQKPE